MLILGLNMFHADASAAIIQDGEVLFAVAEERLNRHKHYGGFPSLAAKACLDAAGAKITDIDHVAVGQDSDANLAKKVQYALANPAKILNFIHMRRRKEAMRDVRTLLSQAMEVDASSLRFQEHHLEHHIAHIASSYYCSPWEKAAGFSYDGSGDFVSTMMARCEGSEIEILERVYLPHSVGSFYTMICEFIGYKKYGDEGKVMGLAPYGKPTYVDEVSKIVTLKNGAFQLDMKYFKPLGSNQGMQVLPDGTVRLARHYSARMEKLFEGQAPAVHLFGGPYYFAEQLGYRKVIDSTFMIGTMIHGDPDPEDLRKFFRALRKAQRDIDLRPELYTHYYKKEFPDRFHAKMDTRRWGPGERLVFEPYTKEVYEESFEWIAAHGIFPEGKMGSGQYERATLSLS